MKTFLYGLIAFTLSIGVGLIAYQLLVQGPSDTGVSITSECGNAVQEPGESCDDGNQVSGDGCSDVCKVETGTTACESTTETFTVTLSSDPGSCTFPTRRRNGRIAGINEVSQTFPANNVCGVQGFNIEGGAGNDNFYYDDSFAISLNGAILLAAHYPLATNFPTNGNLNIWDDFSTIDQKNMTTKGANKDHPNRVEDEPVCAGGVFGSHTAATSCTLPPSQRASTGFTYDIPDDIAAEIGQYLQGASNYTVTLHAVGDDHLEVDCAVSPIDIEITVETKPAGCDCGFVDPVCGNGIQEIGEECDGDGSDYACVPAGQTGECTAIYECSDGLDNDGDGFIDCTPGAPDPGCFPDGRGGGVCNPKDNDETDAITECNDGLDNDGDTFIDCTPGAEDPGCFPDGQGGGGACNPLDDDEENVPTQCNDEEDNDGDGLIDCTPGAEDPGCFPDGNGGGGACNPNDDSEIDITTECSDGIDNDGDGYIDCTAGAPDPGCFPNGNGGGGACNPLDDNERDFVVIPATAFGDDSSQLLILGFSMVITGLMVYKLGFTQKFIDWVPNKKARMYEDDVAKVSDKKRKE